MRLSELTTDAAADVLCTITPYITNITADSAITDTISTAIKTEGLTKAGVLLVGAQRINTLAPLLLKDHRTDVYGILAAIEGVSVAEISAQPLLDTMAQIRELLRDEDFLAFFG